MLRRRFIAWVVTVACALGCSVLATGPSRFPVEDISVPEGADHYVTAPRPNGVVGRVGARELQAEIDAALAERGASAQPDGALAATASWLLREVHDSRSVDPMRVEAAVRHFGFAGMSLSFAAFEIQSGYWREALAKVPRNVAVTRYGIRTSPSGRSAAVVFGDTQLSYEPIPRTLEINQSIVLKGQMSSRFKSGSVFLTKPDGSVDEKRVPGRAFDLSFTFENSGRYQLELMGDGAMGPTPITNVPLYVGIPAPPIRGVAGTVVDPQQAEQRMLTLLNEARRAAGVAPVLPDPELRDVALSHTDDMVEHDFFAHFSPSTGTPDDRLRRSGILISIGGENIALADTPESAHEGLMNSPAHRANILRPVYTHVGIGAATGDRGLIVTQMFGRRPPAGSLPTTAAQVEAAVAALRAAKQLPPVSIDRILRAGAQAGADARAAGAEDKDLDKAVAAGMQRETNLRGNPRAGGEACFRGAELLELTQLELFPVLAHPKLARLGIGARLRRDARGARLITVFMFDGAPCE
jgi:uncharacterized protein YkwD